MIQERADKYEIILKEYQGKFMRGFDGDIVWFVSVDKDLVLFTIKKGIDNNGI